MIQQTSFETKWCKIDTTKSIETKFKSWKDETNCYKKSYIWLYQFWHSRPHFISHVAIGNPEPHMRKASHCGSK